jgi:thymidylate kinase
MLIILEGPDGAGKSTLAREIASQIGLHAKVEVLHAGPLTQHPLDAYEVPLANYRPSTHHVVCDRWHLGEAVYPAVLHRKTRWDTAVSEHVSMFLQARGACVVVLNPRLEELKTRVRLRGDDLISWEQLEFISNGYHKINKRHYSEMYTSKTPTPSEIVRRARQLHLDAVALNSFETYVGPTKPGLLLFGEERAQAARYKRPDLPAFAPFGATSGHYLLSNLVVNSFTPRVGIANACDVDDPEALWKTLGCPRVVTLGNRAHALVGRLKIPHGAVPHPQFVRRFYHRCGHEYSNLIYAAARSREDYRSWRPL